MTYFKVSKKAESDLLNIGAFTQESWGSKQRDKYLDELNTKFQFLTEHPKSGQNRDEVRKGYLCCYLGKHVIFYKVYAYGVRIVRVLHQSMDEKQHL